MANWSSWKIISWSPNDPITDDKMNNMVNNDNLLKKNMVQGRYRGYNTTRDDGVRLMGGLALITARKAANATVAVNFAGFFTQGCRPMITTGTVSKAQRNISITIDGPGAELHPTRDGFQIHANVEAPAKQVKKISRNFYVSWHALGW